MADGYIVDRGNIDTHKLPMFAFTGDYSLTDNGKDGDELFWTISFGSSGEFTTSKDVKVRVYGKIPSGRGTVSTLVLTLKAREKYNVTIDRNRRLFAFGGRTVASSVPASAAGGVRIIMQSER